MRRFAAFVPLDNPIGEFPPCFATFCDDCTNGGWQHLGARNGSGSRSILVYMFTKLHISVPDRSLLHWDTPCLSYSLTWSLGGSCHCTSSHCSGRPLLPISLGGRGAARFGGAVPSPSSPAHTQALVSILRCTSSVYSRWHQHARTPCSGQIVRRCQCIGLC